MGPKGYRILGTGHLTVCPKMASLTMPGHNPQTMLTLQIDLARPMERVAGYGRADRGIRASRQSMPRQALLYRPSVAYSGGMRGAPNPPVYNKGPESHQFRSSPMLSERHQHFGKSTSAGHSLTDQRASFKATHVGHPSKQGQSRIRAESMQPLEARKDTVLVSHRSASCSTPKQMSQRPSNFDPPMEECQTQVNGRCPTESGVVLREKPPSGKNPSPLRHPSYILAVNDDGADRSHSRCGGMLASQRRTARNAHAAH